jgi:DNA adenine methylase
VTERVSTVLAPAPLLRWAGSKRKLITHLQPYWGTGFVRYIEPFVGSAALFYALEPPMAVLGDINPELIQTLLQTRDHPEHVYRELTSIPLGQDSYYNVRREDPSALSPARRAARFLFLNRFCFNGLYRTNRLGQFNVPYAAKKTGTLPTWPQFKNSADRLKSADIRCVDFEALLLATAKTDDFIYLDPPYAVGNRRVFRQYDPQSFGLEDLERLAGLLFELDRRGASFLLSYAYCTEALKAFRGWHKRKVFVHRNISGFVKHRRTAAELLVSNIQL